MKLFRANWVKNWVKNCLNFNFDTMLMSTKINFNFFTMLMLTENHLLWRFSQLTQKIFQFWVQIVMCGAIEPWHLKLSSGSSRARTWLGFSDESSWTSRVKTRSTPSFNHSKRIDITENFELFKNFEPF